MGNHIATCGHEVDEGVCFSIKYDYDSVTASYGTYCAECALMYVDSGMSLNKDIDELISLARIFNRKGKEK